MMNCTVGTTRRTLTAVVMGAMLFGSVGTARAHEDPAGCFETGPAVIVSVFRANGTTGVVGSISECETINYRATLQKATNADTICAFSGGTFKLTTPDGVVHDINLNVPCIGGTAGEGCDPTVTQVQSALIPYTVDSSDIVDGFVLATAAYTGGIAHDSPNNTAGVAATTPKSTPVVLCSDNNLCTTDVCDPALQGSAACSNPPVVCTDNNLCTGDECNPANGQCVFTTVVTCNDNNACTTDVCNPATGQCEFTDNVTPTCNDNNACTQDTCNPATGLCVNTDVVTSTCNDNNLCTTDTCNPATGLCVFTPDVVCTDNNLCTSDACNPATGTCVFTPNVFCNDMSVCTTDVCNPATGLCVYTPITCNDGSVCTTDSCNPATGCVFTPVECDDGDPCTTDTCDPVEGCVSTPLPGGGGGGGGDGDSDSNSDSNNDGSSDSSGDGGHEGDCDDGDSEMSSDGSKDGDSDSGEDSNHDGSSDSEEAYAAKSLDHDSGADSNHDGDSDSEDDSDSDDSSDDCTPTPPACQTFCPCDDADSDSDSGSDANHDGDSDSSVDKSTDISGQDCIPNPDCPEKPLCSCDEDEDSDSGSHDGDAHDGYSFNFGTGGHGDDSGDDDDSDSSDDRDCRPNPDCPKPPVCRSSQYWGTHQSGAKAVIDGVGGCIEVCGEVIKNAKVGSADSAVEALCTGMYADARTRLVRGLTALALNCAMDGKGPDCGSEESDRGELFQECNKTCGGEVGNLTVNKCIAAIECANKGGQFDRAAGYCRSDDDGDNCTTRPVPDKYQQACGQYSSWTCSLAGMNRCTCISPGEQNNTLYGCTAPGNESMTVEHCPTP